MEYFSQTMFETLKFAINACVLSYKILKYGFKEQE